MNVFKKTAAKVVITALLFGLVTVPVNAEVITSNVVEQKATSDLSPNGVILTGEATKDKLTMYGYLYITVTWEKKPGQNVRITGIKKAWTTDPYMKLQNTSCSSSSATAYFYDNTHIATDSIKIYASEIQT
ncbi:MAG: hypothetical protein GXY49_01830 [Syntrophomonadaceae bacterium]|nr:hypothetical protein [Syntrophomonadaceae bacterium]